MDAWQRSHIRRNLVELIRTTTCNVYFLSTLQAEEVISQIDYEDVQSRPTPSEKSRRLYEILQTKTGAFEILVDALLKVHQSGAVDILLKSDNSASNYCQSKSVSRQRISRAADSAPKNKRLKEGASNGDLMDKIVCKHNISKTNAAKIMRDINSGCGVNEVTLLHYAAQTESVDILSSLIDLGCKWRAKTEDGETVLHFAAKGGNFKAIKYIVALGATIGAKAGEFSQTPLHYAVEAKQHFVETIRALVHCGAKINAKDEDGLNLVLLAIQEERSLSDLEEIVRLGGDWKAKDNDGCSVLHYAVECENIDALKYFVRLGANVNSRDIDGETPLHCTCKCDDTSIAIEMLHMLVQNGAKINATNRDGKTVLAFAKSTRKASSMLKYEISKLGGK